MITEPNIGIGEAICHIDHACVTLRFSIARLASTDINCRQRLDPSLVVTIETTGNRAIEIDHAEHPAITQQRHDQF